jgi:hypothetical protein
LRVVIIYKTLLTLLFLQLIFKSFTEYP